MKDNISALTFDTLEDGWKTSDGFILRQIPMPVLDEVTSPDDAFCVIIKVNYAGVCGSDKGIWHRTAFEDLIYGSLKKENKTTRILGHEFSGQIVEVGSMVKSLYSDPVHSLKIDVGSFVSGDSHVTCGTCYQCKIGENNVCLNEKILGISTNGIFAPYVKIPARNLWPVDSAKIRPEICAIFDPFGNAVHAITKVDVRGQSVAVFGCGPIGLFSILLLKNFGATNIIAIDFSDENLQMAQKLGAHQTIKIEKKEKLNAHEYDADVVKKIMELAGGRGVDISMEMAGPVSSVNNCLESTRRGGQVILFGVKDGDFVIPKFSRIITKGLTLHGVIGRRIFQTWQIAQDVLADNSNGVADKIWEVILKKGEGTIINFSEFKKESFQMSMKDNPKIIFNMLL